MVQGSAADWAACWLAELRRRLRALAADGVPAASVAADGVPADGVTVRGVTAHRFTAHGASPGGAGPGTGPGSAELVFFLHDEVMVHAPDHAVDTIKRLLEESARAATRLLFGQIPIEFPVNITVVDSYADAK